MITNAKHAMSAILAVLLSSTAAMAATVYIPNGSPGEILVIDTDTNAIKQRITGLEAVHGLSGVEGGKYLVAGSYAEAPKNGAASVEKPAAVSQDEHAAHHSGADAATAPADTDAVISIVTILDAQTGEAVRRIEVPGAVHHTTMSPDGRYAIATHPSAGGISIIDLENLEVKAFVETGITPNYAVFSADGGTVFVTNPGSSSIAEVSVDDGTVRRRILVGETPEHLIRSADGSKLYVADSDAGWIYEIAVSDLRTLRSIEIGGELHGLDLSEDGTTLFVAAMGNDRIAAVDLGSNAIRSVPLSPAPYHIKTIAGTGKIYISSREVPRVWVVNQSDLTVTGEIPVSGVGHQMVALP